MDDLFKRHPRKPTESEAEARQRIDAQENVLILFRMSVLGFSQRDLILSPRQGKLREGVSSSRRNDAFALEGMPSCSNTHPPGSNSLVYSVRDVAIPVRCFQLC
jgi:hypothetical protein